LDGLGFGYRMKTLKLGEKVKIGGLIYKLVKKPPYRYYWLKRMYIRRKEE
jgi:hypothetical protein